MSAGRRYVYAWLTDSERETFEQIRQQEDCSIADLIRMALNDLAERYGISEGFQVQTHGRKPTKRDA